MAWTPASLHPDLGPGQRFGRTRTWSGRAPILGSEGAALVPDAEVVDVGLEPDRLAELGAPYAPAERAVRTRRT